MKLSIIIVNFNVKYFLANCLTSALKAIEGLNAEIIVVDNASKDGSDVMMQNDFPQIQYIYLIENVGFSRANNVGILRAKGEFILLLNPDTVVQENSFVSCVEFLEDNPNVGGLGVKMIDGMGNFLPESKRGLPTPLVAFYKIFGLASLFPNSEKFGKYHLGFLNKNSNHKVEVLSGAYMMMPKRVLDQIGYLDEDYFMYGEDIDLSFRILKAGFKNQYFAGTTIIHYKGESTKKDSINYVFVFYRAMIIFARKHFEKGSASTFIAIISIAIYFRAFIALVRRLLGRRWQMMLDALVIYTAFIFSTHFYEQVANKDFSESFIMTLIPIYSIVFSIVLGLTGSHDQPFRWIKLLSGWFAGIMTLLAFYALLPEVLRFSRAVILIGSLSGLVLAILWRIIASKISSGGFKIGNPFPNRRLVLGNSKSLATVQKLLTQTKIENQFLAGLSHNTNKPDRFIGGIHDLQKAILEFKVEEIIIDNSTIDFKTTIGLIEESCENQFEIKILNGSWFIGPQLVVKSHVYSRGNELYLVNEKSIKRQKTISDFLLTLVSVLFFPIIIWFVDNKSKYFKNIFKILNGSMTWIGLDSRGSDADLPKIKSGVLHPSMDIIWKKNESEQAFNANVTYVTSPIIINDIQLYFSNLHHLGN